MSYPAAVVSGPYSSSPASTGQWQQPPPPPPPKPAGPSPSTSAQGPPLPPLPPHQASSSEPSELDAGAVLHSPYPPAQPRVAPPQLTIPPVESDWLPAILRDTATTDLHDLLQSPALQTALLSNPRTTHPSVLAAEAAIAPLLEANVALATSLQRGEQQLTAQRAQMQSRLLALRALEQQHRSKISETEEALQQFSPMALYQRLSASVQEQEQLVRGLEESWLEGTTGGGGAEGEGVASEREVGEFVRRVREARKREFLRRERKERWDEGRVGGWR